MKPSCDEGITAVFSPLWSYLLLQTMLIPRTVVMFSVQADFSRHAFREVLKTKDLNLSTAPVVRVSASNVALAHFPLPAPAASNCHS